MGDLDPVADWIGCRHLRPRVDAATGSRDILAEGLCDPDEVDHAGGRRVNRRDAAGVGLDLPYLVCREPTEAGHCVRTPTPLELVETLDLALVGGDDQLPGAPVGYLPLRAEGIKGARALDAQPCLQRPGLVVDAGVDDTARMARLVP